MRHGRACVLVLLVSMLAGFVAAQIDSSHPGRLRIHILFLGGGCDAATHVTLIGHDGAVAAGDADQKCNVNFESIPEGRYGLNLSAKNLPDSDLGTITLNSLGAAEFDVMLKRPTALDRSYAVAANSLISATDLTVPDRARKPFQQANALMEREDSTGAIEKLNQAVAVYPDYAMAYNNLGVLYSRLGDKEHGREALRRALSLDDQLGLAYLNLGRIDITSGEFSEAASSLGRAAVLAPDDPLTLLLLSYAEMMDGRFDDAIATSRKAHALARPHAFVHRLAADSFLRKGDAPDAITELNRFLAEEPNGPEADSVRKELAKVQAVTRQAARPAAQ